MSEEQDYREFIKQIMEDVNLEEFYRDNARKFHEFHRNKVSDEQFNVITSLLNPQTVDAAAEVENVETPEERRLRMDDERDYANILWYEQKIAELKAKRESRAKLGFHIDPNALNVKPKRPEPRSYKVDFDRDALNQAITATKCPLREEMCQTLEMLTDDELVSLAVEIQRQIDEDNEKLRKEFNTYNSIDWDEVAREYDLKNST